MSGWEGTCDVSRKYFADGAFSEFLPSLSWSSSKALIDFSITWASPDPSFQELCFTDPWINFFPVLPKRVCLSLLQLVVTPALNYCVSSPFAVLLLSWALFGEFILLSFSSCHPLLLCCHSRLPSFRTLLLVLIALFLTAVVFLPSEGIIYQSPQLFHFLIPSALVLSLLSHQNPSLSPPSHLAIHQPCPSWFSYLCSFYSDYRSFNFPWGPLSELLHPALTPHFISSCYL